MIEIPSEFKINLKKSNSSLINSDPDAMLCSSFSAWQMNQNGYKLEYMNETELSDHLIQVRNYKYLPNSYYKYIPTYLPIPQYE